MENILRSYLNGKIPPADLQIHYHIGNTFSGETDFRLRGDGAYQLSSTVTQERQRRDYSGQLDMTEVQDLARTALSGRLWEVKHFLVKRGRDNPEVLIEVKAGKESSATVLSVREVEEVPAFDKVQSEILTLVHRVSCGEVLEVGR